MADSLRYLKKLLGTSENRAPSGLRILKVGGTQIKGGLGDMFSPSTREMALDLASQQLVKQSPIPLAAGVLSPDGLGAHRSL